MHSRTITFKGNRKSCPLGSLLVTATWHKDLLQQLTDNMPINGVRIHMATQLTLVATLRIQEEVTVGRQPVASCSTNFLHIALKVSWHIIMDYRAYVRLIDAHTKGNGGHHNAQLIAHEGLLNGSSPGSGHSSVIGLSLPIHTFTFFRLILSWLPTVLHARSNKPSDTLTLVTTRTIDNNGLAGLEARMIKMYLSLLQVSKMVGQVLPFAIEQLEQSCIPVLILGDGQH